MKFLIAAATASAVGLAGLYSVGNASLQKELTDCNKGNTAICYGVSDHLQNKITNIQYHDRLQTAKFVRQAEEKKAEEAREAVRKNLEAEEAKRIAAANAAEAKFKAEGWFELEPGIYGRWCTETCSTAEVIGDQAYWLMEVWAKDRAAGDVYAQINVIRNGVIIGWTNDTAYIGAGQRAVLTFGKYGLDNSGQYTAELVKFNARG